MTQPRLPLHPVAPPTRTDAHAPDRFTAEETPTRPGITDVVHQLANEALERSVRDRSMLAIGERVARGVEALVVLERDRVMLAPTAARWPTAAWLAIALSAGVLGAALDRALVAPTAEVQHVR